MKSTKLSAMARFVINIQRIRYFIIKASVITLDGGRLYIVAYYEI